MRTSPRSATWLTVGVVASVGLAGGLSWFGLGNFAPSVIAAGVLPNAEVWKDCKYQNAAQCSRCHVKPAGADLPPRDPNNKAPYAIENALMTEYAIWKTYDKHAQAYAVLKGPRGQLMGKLLGQDVLKAETGCLNCHAMGNLAGAADQGGLDPLDGVSCGGCHGPSSKWFLEHTQFAWRNVPPEEKFKKGLRDLRDPVVKSTLCMSCHIGNAEEGKVVTHAMFAAGHPPLPPIEIATFARNEPQHWRDVRDVPMFKNPTPAMVKNFHLEDKAFARTRLAVIGSVVALRETMKLAAARSDLKAADPPTVWPELLMTSKDEPAGANDTAGRVNALWPEIAMAHSDRYACHHDLKYPGFRQQRGFGYDVPGRAFYGVRPGRPLVRLWPIAPLAAASVFKGDGKRLDELDARLKTLAAACNARPFGTPDGIAKSSDELTRWADEVIKDLNDPSKTRYTSESVLALMHNICQLFDASTGKNADGSTRRYLPDYETARQLASILTVAYDEWKLAGGKADGVQAMLDTLSKQLDLQPYTKREDRLEIVLRMVTGGQGRNVDQSIAEFKKYLDNIGDIAALIKVSEDRDVLDAVQRINNADFNSGILRHIDQLQKFGDEEEAVVLKSISDYDPLTFLAELKKIDKALPAGK